MSPLHFVSFVPGVRTLAVGLCFLWIAILSPLFGFAHMVEATRNRLEITSLGNAVYEINWKHDRKELELVLPKDCRKQTPLKDNLWRWQCEQPLSGRPVTIQNLLVNDAEVLARVDSGESYVQVELLSRQHNQFVLREPTRTSRWQVAGTYLIIGVEHILLGFDHLLFVLCLLLVLSGWKKLAMAITAFTVAHSITLALSVFAIVRLPIAPVEAVIALSIVLLATEYAQQQKGEEGWTTKKPWIVSFAVGLLHGLGFASALRGIGLPEGEIPLAFVMFNVGVEVGQLAFVTVTLPLLFFGARLLGERTPWLPMSAAYSIGGIASFWFLERTFS